jgi:hypothetical protein
MEHIKLVVVILYLIQGSHRCICGKSLTETRDAATERILMDRLPHFFDNIKPVFPLLSTGHYVHIKADSGKHVTNFDSAKCFVLVHKARRPG